METLKERRQAPWYLRVAALAAGGLSLTGCGSRVTETQPLKVASHVIVGNQAHFGIVGSAGLEHVSTNVTSHMQLDCRDRGAESPVVTVQAHSLIGTHQRFETVVNLSDDKKETCQGYLAHFTDTDAVNQLTQSLLDSRRPLFTDGHRVHGDLGAFAEGLLRDAANGAPVR